MFQYREQDEVMLARTLPAWELDGRPLPTGLPINTVGIVLSTLPNDRALVRTVGGVVVTMRIEDLEPLNGDCHVYEDDPLLSPLALPQASTARRIVQALRTLASWLERKFY